METNHFNWCSSCAFPSLISLFKFSIAFCPPPSHDIDQVWVWFLPQMRTIASWPVSLSHVTSVLDNIIDQWKGVNKNQTSESSGSLNSEFSLMFHLSCQPTDKSFKNHRYDQARNSPFSSHTQERSSSAKAWPQDPKLTPINPVTLTPRSPKSRSHLPWRVWGKQKQAYPTILEFVGRRSLLSPLASLQPAETSNGLQLSLVHRWDIQLLSVAVPHL